MLFSCLAAHDTPHATAEVLPVVADDGGAVVKVLPRYTPPSEWEQVAVICACGWQGVPLPVGDDRRAAEEAASTRWYEKHLPVVLPALLAELRAKVVEQANNLPPVPTGLTAAVICEWTDQVTALAKAGERLLNRAKSLEFLLTTNREEQS